MPIPFNFITIISRYKYILFKNKYSFYDKLRNEIEKKELSKYEELISA